MKNGEAILNNMRSGGKNRKLKEYTPAYLMLLPNLIMFSVFVLYPLMWALRFMFYEYDGVSQPLFVGLDNFVRVITRDPVWWQAVGNTLLFAFGKLILEIPIAVIFAVLLNDSLKGKSIFRGIFFLPTVTSAAVMSLVFTFMFSPYNGFVNGYLEKFGLINTNVNWLSTPSTAMIVCILTAVWQVFGQNMLLVLSGLQNISKEVYESAEIDGANKIQSFFKITLPLLAPMLQIIICLAIIGSLQVFDSIFVLTAGGPNHQTEVMGISIYNHFFSTLHTPSYGYGATLGFISSLIIGIITIIYFILSKKMKKVYE